MSRVKNDPAVINTDIVRSRMIVLRDCHVLLDRDVAELYGVQTKEVNQVVRNDPDKFPEGFLFQLDADEVNSLRSKNLTLNEEGGRGKHSKHGYKAFTERGLYMLATILKGALATQATLAIVNTYAQLRSMVRDMESLQTLKDGSPSRRRSHNSRSQVGGAHKRQSLHRIDKDDNRTESCRAENHS